MPYAEQWVSRRDFAFAPAAALAAAPVTLSALKVVPAMRWLSIQTSPCKQQIHTGTNVYKCAWRFNPTWTGVNSRRPFGQLLGQIYDSGSGTPTFMAASHERMSFIITESTSLYLEFNLLMDT